MNPAEENEVRQILEKRLCTQEQVDEAVAIQGQMEAMGLRPRSVPEVLCEKGYLDAADLEQVQREETTIEGRDRIAGYQIQELLGRGAMGAVYKARQLSLDRDVALKVLDPELAGDAAYADRFLTEARAVARLNHTNLVSGIDVGDEEGIKYLVMEYADGITMARLLRRGGVLDEERALTLAMQVARALEYVHRHGVVHGDVRPENVMITSDGVTKLCDLGIARRPLVAGDDGGTPLRRTPDYISPEQARGRADVGAAADLYGLGATLFHAVTGRPPFLADSREAVLAKHLTEPAPAARTITPQLSARTEALLQRCLQKGPADRHPDATALLQDLEQALTQVKGTRGSGSMGGPGGVGPGARPAPGAKTAAPGARPKPATPGGAPVSRKRRRRR